MTAKKKKILIVAGIILGVPVAIIVFLSCLPAGPPDLIITGVVTDANTGQPIAGAKVSDDGYGPKPSWGSIRAGDCSPWGAVTDSDGKYSYLTWPEHHGIKAQAAGYKAHRKSLYKGHFVLQKDSEEVMDFALEPE